MYSTIAFLASSRVSNCTSLTHSISRVTDSVLSKYVTKRDCGAWGEIDAAILAYGACAIHVLW